MVTLLRKRGTENRKSVPQKQAHLKSFFDHEKLAMSQVQQGSHGGLTLDVAWFLALWNFHNSGRQQV